MHAPSRLIITDFHDSRNRFDHYWPRLRELDVPTPDTTIIPIVEEDGDWTWDTTEILAFMDDRDAHRAFVRSQYKSAPRRPRDGSFIAEPTVDEIDDTVRSLLAQHDAVGIPHGGSLVVREFIDLNYCPHPSHSACHPEVRAFIEDGHILAITPPEDAQYTCPGTYEHLAADRPYGHPPRDLVEVVADAFPEASWAVDFVRATDGTWYCTELGLNGVYWNSTYEEWWNICGHGSVTAVSPVETYRHHLRQLPRGETPPTG